MYPPVTIHSTPVHCDLWVFRYVRFTVYIEVCTVYTVHTQLQVIITISTKLCTFQVWVSPPVSPPRTPPTPSSPAPPSSSESPSPLPMEGVKVIHLVAAWPDLTWSFSHILSTANVLCWHRLLGGKPAPGGLGDHCQRRWLLHCYSTGTVQCTVCTVHCTLYTVHYTVHCTLYTVHCTLYCTLYTTLYTVHCTLYTVHCTLYTVHCTLYTVHCTMYIVHCTLYTRPCRKAPIMMKQLLPPIFLFHFSPWFDFLLFILLQLTFDRKGLPLWWKIWKHLELFG